MSSESYGLSLGSILFVKDLDERGPAGRDGQLERGDVILKVRFLQSSILSVTCLYLHLIVMWFSWKQKV